MTIDLNTVLTASAIGALGFVAQSLFKTVTLVERLDERTKQHSDRIDNLEAKVA